jgi:hypothetical protein
MTRRCRDLFLFPPPDFFPLHSHGLVSYKLARCECYICVLMLLYLCPHTAVYVSSYCYVCVLILLYVCVLMLLYMCPHTAMYFVLILLHMCSHELVSYTTTHVQPRVLLHMCRLVSYTTTHVQPRVLHVLILLHMCSHGPVSYTHARTVSAPLLTDEPSVSTQTFAQLTSRLSAKRRSV